jgi:transposase
MTAWLVAEQVTHVAMEATGVYWRPVFHALAEAGRLEILLCNAYHVKNVPGRKTDACDAVWLAQLCEVGLLRGSFIPPAEIAAVRELVRYRALCRCRHNACYAEVRVMPRLERVCWPGAVIGRSSSA